jgi:hypothetical protein
MARPSQSASVDGTAVTTEPDGAWSELWRLLLTPRSGVFAVPEAEDPLNPSDDDSPTEPIRQRPKQTAT